MAWRDSRSFQKDRVLEADAAPLKNMTITAIAMAEDMRTELAFGGEKLGAKWRRFMEFFSMLYGTTKYFVDVEVKKEMDAFMEKWLLYAFAVRRYKEMQSSVAEGTAKQADVQKQMDAMRELFGAINPKSSLDKFEEYVVELKRRNIYSLAESSVGEEGDPEPEEPKDPFPGPPEGEPPAEPGPETLGDGTDGG